MNRNVDTTLEEIIDYFLDHEMQEREESVYNMVSYELNYEDSGNMQPNNFVYVMMINDEYTLGEE